MEIHYFRPCEEKLAEYMPKGVSRGILRNVLAVFRKMESLCVRIRSSVSDVLGDSGHLSHAAEEVGCVFREIAKMADIKKVPDKEWDLFGVYADVAVLLSELHRTLDEMHRYLKERFENLGGSGGYVTILEQIEGLHRYLGMYEIEPGDDNEWYNVIRSFGADGDDLVRCITNNTALTAMAITEFGLDESDGVGLSEYVKSDPQKVRRLMAERFEGILTSLERLELGSGMWALNFKNTKREFEECFQVLDDIIKNLKDEMRDLIEASDGDKKVRLEILNDRLFGDGGAVGLVYGYFSLVGAIPDDEGEDDVKNRPLETLPETYDTIARTYESFYRPMMGVLHNIKEGNYEPVASRVTKRNQRESGDDEDIA
jgi:hypothetical protein